jgi:A/G-specific adenine glycosylase
LQQIIYQLFMEFSAALLSWYKENRRDLPWRAVSDPYQIWLSEIILQQTRVEQGMPYYKRFVSAFPKVQDLAAASEEEVLKLWQGLGYYSRARNLHFAAKQIVNDFEGRFPADYEAIRSLKGVGDYTAAAIASFAFDLPHAVVDGNVYRLLSRYFGIETAINSTQGKKEFAQLANDLLFFEDPAQYNQAIMEFGSLQCKISKPSCASCPLANTCWALANKATNRLPYKEKKLKVQKRYFDYFYIVANGQTLVKKRAAKGIWQNLYDFPLVDSAERLDDEALLLVLNETYGVNIQSQDVRALSKVYVHLLSHRRIEARFWTVNLDSLPNEGLGLRKIDIEDLQTLPVPRLIDLFLQDKVLTA